MHGGRRDFDQMIKERMGNMLDFGGVGLSYWDLRISVKDIRDKIIGEDLVYLDKL
jgi:hypothetical protein